VRWPSLLLALIAHVRLSIRLLRDPRVPLLLKAMPVLTALYVLSPIDLLPDVLPILGEVDDLAVSVLTLQAFVRLCPAAAVDFHRAAIAERRRYSPMPPAGEIIDAEFRREEDEP
jgi:uncharacterized membrane protein YkvA (DUF1232 family)